MVRSRDHIEWFMLLDHSALAGMGSSGGGGGTTETSITIYNPYVRWWSELDLIKGSWVMYGIW